MKDLKLVLEKVYSDSELRKSVVPLFIGNPGLGKTKIIENFTKEKNTNLVELITSQMSPFEVSGIAMPDKETQKMIYYNFDKLENLKDGDILFFDELLNGNPVVLNACLTILEQRRLISGKALPDIMIVAAANPQGMAPLTPQIKERFIWYRVKFDKQMWIDYMQDKYYITRSIGYKLANLIINENFTSDNFHTPRSIDKALNMIINEVPTPYETELKDILNEPIKNPFEKEVDLGNKKLLPNEMISWLDLIRLKNGVKVTEKVEEIIEEEFILPEFWYIQSTEDTFDEIYNYYKKQSNPQQWGRPTGRSGWVCFYNTSSYISWVYSKESLPEENKEITIEQFRKYVLNK